MKAKAISIKGLMAVLVLGTLAHTQVLADKPPWAGQGKGKEKQAERVEVPDKHPVHPATAPTVQYPGPSVSLGVRFTDNQRFIVQDYYRQQMAAGFCPPGLAKKGTGCLPPGQAKKWAIGQPLPKGLIFYDLPSALVGQLGVAPPGYRYVRVANDILMIAIGTGLVADAIADLSR